MPCIRLGPPFNGVLTIPGPTYTIHVGGKPWYFELDSYPGFNFVTKDGGEIKNYPPERHPVWDAIEAWEKQGKRVDENGVCV